MRTRFAPTPSGYLHAGNAVNALLVHWLARSEGGHVILRIDDMDATRARDAYVDDIFDLLTWLDVAWDSGPHDAADFRTTWSQSLRTEYYRTQLEDARGRGLEVYACRCSRRELAGRVPTGGCGHGCRERDAPHIAGETALRVHVPVGTVVSVNGAEVDVAAAHGDFVVWRRDDLPAYHLVSVVEDRDAGVTHIVRGADLFESTAAQLFLAPRLGAGSVVEARHLHHRLLLDDRGHKLSKSHLAQGPLPRTPELRDLLVLQAVEVGADVGIAAPS